MATPDLLNGKAAGGATEKKIVSVLRSYLSNGIAFYWSSFFILILIEFFLGGQLSKLLTRPNYALYVSVLNTLPFYNVVVNVGISYVIIYMISYNPDVRFSLFRSGLKLQNIWYLMLVVVHAVMFAVFRNTFTQCLLITVLISYTYSYRLNMNSFFLGTRSYNKAALSNGLQKTGMVLLILLVTAYGALRQQLNDRFIILFPAIEIGIVLLYFIVFRQTNYDTIRAPRVSYTRRILKYGKYSMLNNGMNVFYYLILAVIIRASRIDVHTQIVMSLCIVFFRYSGAVVAPFVSITIPQFTRIKDDRIRVKALYRRYFLFILLLALITMAGCRLLFAYVIDKFYSAAYHDIPVYFYFFCYLIPLLYLNALNTQLIAALGKIKYTFTAEFVCTVLLLTFYIYNLISPMENFHVLYYMVLIHLCAKFLMLNYGLYLAIVRKQWS